MKSLDFRTWELNFFLLLLLLALFVHVTVNTLHCQSRVLLFTVQALSLSFIALKDKTTTTPL